MQCGIVCDENCIPIFGKMKMDKSISYIIFKIDDNDEFITVEKEGDKNATYEEFCNSFPQKEARYGVFDYHFKNEEGRSFSKIIFVFWCAAGTKMQMKFKYASTQSEIRSKLQGVSVGYEARDISDIDAKEVVDKDMAKF